MKSGSHRRTEHLNQGACVPLSERALQSLRAPSTASTLRAEGKLARHPQTRSGSGGSGERPAPGDKDGAQSPGSRRSGAAAGPPAPAHTSLLPECHFCHLQQHLLQGTAFIVRPTHLVYSLPLHIFL